MNLSDHFTLEELTYSEVALRRGLDNTPTEEQVVNLMGVAEDLLEPARALLGVPLVITSGFRSKVINKIVGGAVDSVHPEGLAADFRPLGFPLVDAFDAVRLSPKIVYDQIIIECNSWIHIAKPRSGVRARREALRARGTPGKWIYELVT